MLGLKRLELADLEPGVRQAFDRRLRSERSAPLCVAYSGGGDSLLALLATKAWAEARGRAVTALCVDHRLQPHSGDWTGQARATAAALGVGFHALAWEGAKPRTGVAAAARAARHGLLAEAARKLGASVVVFGHTADDILEAELMRQEGSTLGLLREWAPSPAWPQGRGIFLLRPLLGVRRAAIREALVRQGCSWIDDPANEDPRSPRARARIRLAGGPGPASIAEPCAQLSALARATQTNPQGWLGIARETLKRASSGAGRRWVAAAVLSVGGGARLPRGERLSRLYQSAVGDDDFTATLAGAKVTADSEQIRLFRDAGERGRGGLAPATLVAGEASVWDGRFEIIARRDGTRVRALAGVMARLEASERRRIDSSPAQARPGLPALVGADGSVRLAGGDELVVRSLAGERLLAACGAILREPAA